MRRKMFHLTVAVGLAALPAWGVGTALAQPQQGQQEQEDQEAQESEARQRQQQRARQQRDQADQQEQADQQTQQRNRRDADRAGRSQRTQQRFDEDRQDRDGQFEQRRSDRAGQDQGFGRTGRRARGQQQQAWTTDTQIAAWVAADNLMEIQLAQWAEQRATNPRVQDFAGMLIEEHQALIDQLQQIEPQAVALARSQLQMRGRQPGRGQDQDQFAEDRGGQRRGQNQRQTAQRGDEFEDEEDGEFAQDEQERRQGRRGGASFFEPSRVTRQEVLGQGEGLDFVTIKMQLAQRYQDSIRRELQETGEGKFDEMFVRTQVGLHQAMIDNLQVLQQYASQDLASALQQAAQKTQHHLQEAEDLLAQLEQGQAGQGRQDQRRPGQGRRGRPQQEPE